MVFSTKGLERQLACNTCGPNRRHVVEEFFKQDAIDAGEESWWLRYEICRCLGCDAVVFRYSSMSTHALEVDPDTGHEVPVEFAQLMHTQEPTERIRAADLPEELRAAYVQTKTAVRSQQNILAGVGLRAILEFVSAEKSAAGNKLKNQIRSLVQLGKCPFDVDTLDKIRFIGNDAAHRLDHPSDEEIDIATRLVENLLEAFWILPAEAKRIQRTESTQT